MARNFESEYFGLLHILKEMAGEIRPALDVLPNSANLSRLLMMIDHEVAKGCNGPRGQDQKT